MNAFTWDDGTPSIFCTPQALRHARAVATSQASSTKHQAKKPRKEPKIRARPEEKQNGRPALDIDMSRVLRMRAAGWTIRRIAEALERNPKTIGKRLSILETK